MSVAEIIRRAIEIGERNGKITFDELNQLCDSRELDPKDIERVLNALSAAGVWIEGD
ncbi:RNA polymerase subunit sigma-70 [Bradyrhizobium sp. CSA207]|uniref:RNA polymerase sigma factor region1.1 domain-containing protein n=1 Tax=Bradyrhizobium sp. CSA207 TaxID=2698826 RepID=UPI0023AFAF2D|nr:RNA polymerase sigma factor region1.1 domain-containing protein [Bradyrhizobium sp. CSA207]MDE5445374.1 RNA polymerase subunit sigma-70 [Bradyrhizobium sp. CSA207]